MCQERGVLFFSREKIKNMLFLNRKDLVEKERNNKRERRGKGKRDIFSKVTKRFFSKRERI